MKNKTNEAKRILGIIKESMKINENSDDNLVKSNDPNVYKQFMISQTMQGFDVMAMAPEGTWHNYSNEHFKTPQEAKAWFAKRMGSKWNDKYKLYVSYFGKKGEII